MWIETLPSVPEPAVWHRRARGTDGVETIHEFFTNARMKGANSSLRGPFLVSAQDINHHVRIEQDHFGLSRRLA